jgi:hypothetical protein
MSGTAVQDLQMAEDRLLGPLLEKWLDEIKALPDNQPVKAFISIPFKFHGIYELGESCGPPPISSRILPKNCAAFFRVPLSNNSLP